ncbi:DUF4926 domain-containing protein, partial [Candidatus Hakubella thermalkaliphila]
RRRHAEIGNHCPRRLRQMKFKLLETVVLTKDLKQYGLKRGDLGAIVEIYGSHNYEVEFVTADGHTQALVELNERDLRPVESRDIVSVRSLQATV